ncbi:hypothetical protein MIR68_004643 [Amoeboaphelidium protococcarum]|nr:hypothetical protein MIR68_004643 [Amoeboaphelidium protococcarum]
MTQIATVVKLIVSQQDLEKFLSSIHFDLFWNGFMLPLNQLCVEYDGDCLQAQQRFHDELTSDQAGNLEKVLNLIDKCQDALRLFPRGSSHDAQKELNPTASSHRFGHVEFRHYYQYIWDNVLEWICGQEQQQDGSSSWLAGDSLLTENALSHILPYFLHSFGDLKRIDYGTGHELNFMVFVYALVKHQFLHLHSSLALVLLNRYIVWMRAVQSEYWLEPAGSHGVWGLDDYQFLPFLFGSAQLVGHQYLRPKDICDHIAVEEHGSYGCKNSWMFFESVKFIYDVKFSGEGSLAWHSPMLYDISAIVPKKIAVSETVTRSDGTTYVKEKQVAQGCRSGWDRVNNGLIKMYLGECLKKLPIMQHFLFGEFMGLVGREQYSDVTLKHWMTVLCDGNVSKSQCIEEFKTEDSHQRVVDVPNASVINRFEDGGNNGNDHGHLQEDQEVVIKYVEGPNGKKIPIYGKMSQSHHGCSHSSGNSLSADSQSNGGGGGGLVETFALGQSFPTCCNMRIPSAIGAQQQSQKKRTIIPFD